MRNVEELRKAVSDWVANPAPMPIDARISRSVVTLPCRRIHYGEDAQAGCVAGLAEIAGTVAPVYSSPLAFHFRPKGELK